MACDNRVYLSYDGKKSVNDILQLPYIKTDPVFIDDGYTTHPFYSDDNLNVLLNLLNNGYRGKIDLVYIDPPYASQLDLTTSTGELAYSDKMVGADYVEFIRERLIIIRELLAKTGSIYVHLDKRMAFTIKLVMDEVFGKCAFKSFITRKKCSSKLHIKKNYGNVSDYVLFYTKSGDYTWNKPYSTWEDKSLRFQFHYVDINTGRRYRTSPIYAPGIVDDGRCGEWRGEYPPKGQHWIAAPDELDKMDNDGMIYWSKNGRPRRKVFCDMDKAVPISDIWMDFVDVSSQMKQITGYPSEKNGAMLRMILQASSNPGDLVMDCFSGSGSFLVSASEMGRRWIGVDSSPESLKTIKKRFNRE